MLEIFNNFNEIITEFYDQADEFIIKRKENLENEKEQEKIEI